MTFGEAIEALKAGTTVRRTAWQYDDRIGRSVDFNPVIFKFSESSNKLYMTSLLPPWVDTGVPWEATVADKLAQDWQGCGRKRSH